MAPTDDPSMPGGPPRRRRTRPWTTTLALVALTPSLVHGAHPASIKKNPKKHARKNRATVRGSTVTDGEGGNNLIADAAVAAEGVAFAFGAAQANGSSNNRGNMVVVQPEHLRQSSSSNVGSGGSSGGGDTSMTYSELEEAMAANRRGDVQLHAWPHPDDLPPQQQPQQLRAGDPQPYGMNQGTVEYYKDGQARQSSAAENLANSAAKYNQDGQAVQSGRAMGSSASENLANSAAKYYDENGQAVQSGQAMQSSASENLANSAAKYYQNGQAMQSSGNAARKRVSGGANAHGKQHYEQWHTAAYNYGSTGEQPNEVQVVSSQALPSPQEDLDVVSGKQVILRPRLSSDEAAAGTMALPPMGSAQGNKGEGNGGAPVVYYYDPQALQSTASSSGKGDAAAAPELTLPEVVYDAAGRAMKMEEVHAGGRNEVFLEVKPKAVWGSGVGDRLSSIALEEHLTMGSLRDKFGFHSESSSGSSGAGAQGQDQLIVLLTVATMAVMVGALSAKRLRSRRMLESCMHPELDDEFDDDIAGSATGSLAATPRYDKKFDVDTTGSATSGGSARSGGFGALLGSRKGGATGGYYGTAGDDGLHWRGDTEKFDV